MIPVYEPRPRQGCARAALAVAAWVGLWAAAAAAGATVVEVVLRRRASRS